MPNMNETLLPLRGNGFSAFLGRLFLRVFGWRVVGSIPDVPRAVIIGGPHTSNWDGVFTLAAMVSLRLDARVMIKDSAFRWPLGIVLRWLGAMPIDRNSAKGVVQQTVDQFLAHERMVIVVAPEGTRDGASQWKSGFWHIASAAGVPIIIATADYQKKQIAFPALVTPGADMDRDMATILECYRGVEPRHPERLSAPLAAMRRQEQEKHHV